MFRLSSSALPKALGLLIALGFLGTASAAFYEPSPYVESVNKYPHFNPATQEPTSNTFGHPNNNDYYMGVAGLPIYVLVVGIIALVLLPLLLALRCCCRCIRCLPGHRDAVYVDKQGNKRHSKNVWLFGAYYLVCLCALVFAHLMFMASDSFSKAITTSSDALGELEDLFTDIIDENDAASLSMDTVISDMDSVAGKDPINDSVCWDGSSAGNGDLYDTVLGIETAIEALSVFVDPLPDFMADGAAYIEQGEGYQRTALFGCYAGIMALIIIYVVLELCHLKAGLKMVMPLSWVIVGVLTVLCCIELTILMVTCDFCVDPTASILSNLKEGSSTYDIINDFIGRDANGDACTGGGSALEDLIDDIQDTITVASDDLADTVANDCTGVGLDTTAMDSIIDLIDNNIQDLIDAISGAVNCMTIHNLWVDILETAMCTHFAEGMYFFWVSKHLTALFLYLLMCLGSITWQYFGVLSDSELEDDEDAYNNFVSGGIVVNPDSVTPQKKETKVIELTQNANSRGRLRGLF